MARIRTVKPAFFRHRQLFLAERETGLPLRLAFEGLWTVADREGRFKWEPDEHKLDCLPYDDVDFSRVMDALATRGFIVKYRVGGRDYGVIPSFGEHQVINNREVASKLPPPPETSEITDTTTRELPVDDASGTRVPRDAILHEWKGREQEGKGSECDARAIDLRVSVVKIFEEFGQMPPDTAHVHLWVAQGFDPSICIAVVREKLSRKKRLSNLSYCDEAIREAQEKRAPAGSVAKPTDWETWVDLYKRKNLWAMALGPEPGYDGCRAPPEILAKHGYLKLQAAE
jgi:hypothetical protein